GGGLECAKFMLLHQLAIGGWYYTATFDDLSGTQSNGQPVRHRGSSGFYVLTDQVLYKDPVQHERKVAGFVQAGVGDSRIDRFGAYIGTGLTTRGIIEGVPRLSSESASPMPETARTT